MMLFLWTIISTFMFSVVLIVNWQLNFCSGVVFFILITLLYYIWNPHTDTHFGGINPTLIDSQYERTPPPWEKNNIMFNASLLCFKKDQTSGTVFQREYQQLREQYNSNFEAYTDASKCEQKVAAAT